MRLMEKVIWIDGETRAPTAHDVITSAAFSYGLVAFEGIVSAAARERSGGRHIFRLREHLERLRGSTMTLGWEPPYSVEQLAAAAVKLVRAMGRGSHYLRPVVFSRKQFTDLNLGGWWTGTSVAMFGVRFDLGRLVRHMQREIKACVATSVRAAWPAALAGAKISGKYLSLVWAREEARRLGCDEAIILDDTDHVAEASTANLFAVKDGVLATPSVTQALPGITRATVIELAGGLGVRVEERAIHRDELWEADEIFLTNTAHGVVGLRELDGGWRSRGRKLTDEVRRVYLEVLEGRDARHADWLTRVDADA